MILQQNKKDYSLRKMTAQAALSNQLAAILPSPKIRVTNALVLINVTNKDLNQLIY